jgi:hypothetical protein
VAEGGRVSPNAVHEGAGPVKRPFLSCPGSSQSGVLHESARHQGTGVNVGRTPAEGCDVDAGAEWRILDEDAYVVLRVPITALGSVTLPWAASHSFVDLRT